MNGQRKKAETGTAGAVAPDSAALGAPAAAQRWVASWTAAPQLTEPDNLPPAPYNQDGGVLRNATLRQTVRVAVGGPRIRLRFSNTFGGAPLPITAASVAFPAGGRAGASGIEAGTATAVTFGGQPSVTVPVGARVLSDPLDFPLRSRSNVTVTVYLAEGQASHDITSHPGSRTTSHLVSGNHVGDVALSAATAVEHWYFLSGLEVLAPAETSVTVLLGDSLTDGRGSTTNGNDRWPDRLLDRLQTQAGISGMSIVNQAMGGNRVLADGVGPSAVSRFDRDVLQQEGIKRLVIFEGINDLGSAAPTGSAQNTIIDALLAEYERFITRAHAAGITVYGATITPFGGNDYDDAAGVRQDARQTVNAWIRGSGRFDAVLDFDRAVRDPANPRWLQARYDTGDHLHLNATGYQALADAVPARLFTA